MMENNVQKGCTNNGARKQMQKIEKIWERSKDSQNDSMTNGENGDCNSELQRPLMPRTEHM